MRRIFATIPSPPALHLGLLLLRIGVAALLLTHGFPKLSKVLSGDFAFGDPIGLGSGVSLTLSMLAEAGCSILILLGAGTRLAVIPLIINMLVIFFVAHGADPFGKRELPLMYLIIYIVLLILGSGKYSIDNLLDKRSDRVF